MKLMRTQDIKYVEMKRVAEAKVIFHFFSGFLVFSELFSLLRLLLLLLAIVVMFSEI